MAGILEYAERIRGVTSPADEEKSVTGAFLVPSRTQSVSPVWRLFGVREGRMPLKKGTKDGYNASEWVAISVDRIVEAVASVPWRVSREVSDTSAQDKARHRFYMKGLNPVEQSAYLRELNLKNHILEPMLDHPLEKLLEQPNKFTDGSIFVSYITQHLLLAGNAITTKVRVSTDTKIKELWNINPDSVEPIPDPAKFIREYRIYKGSDGTLGTGNRGSSDYKDVKTDDVMHFQLPNPLTPFWGRSPLEAAAMIVDTDREAMQWQKQSLENLASPSSVIALEQGIPPAKFDTYLEQFRKQYAGKENARTPILLGHGARYFQTSFSPVEMDFINSRNAHRDAILAIYGVNKVVAGAQEANNTGIKEARRDFWVATIIPYLTRFQAALNRTLAAEYGEDIFIWPDLSNVDALRENYHDQVKSAALLARIGFSGKAINRRLTLGFLPEELEYLDYALMPASTRYLPEIIAGLNEPNGDPGQAQPDVDIAPLEPGDNTDDPTAEGLEGEKSWTVDEAKTELDVYNVSWEGEVQNSQAAGFRVDKASYEDADTLMLSLSGVKRFWDERGDMWIAFRKHTAIEGGE